MFILYRTLKRGRGSFSWVSHIFKQQHASSTAEDACMGHHCRKPWLKTAARLRCYWLRTLGCGFLAHKIHGPLGTRILPWLRNPGCMRGSAWLRIQLNHQTHEMIHSDIVHGLCQGLHGVNGRETNGAQCARYGWQHKSIHGGRPGHSMAPPSMRSTSRHIGKQTQPPVKAEKSDSTPMAPKTQ